MPRLFNVDIAGIVHRSMSAGLLPATLTKRTIGTRTPGDLTSGTNPTTTTYAARGVVTDYTDGEMQNSPVRIGARRILLIAKSIAGGAAPVPGDSVTIEGSTYKIDDRGVVRDPASASYECRARK